MESNTISTPHTLFSGSRFWSLCQWDYMANRKAILARALTVTGILLVVFLLGRLTFANDPINFNSTHSVQVYQSNGVSSTNLNTVTVSNHNAFETLLFNPYISPGKMLFIILFAGVTFLIMGALYASQICENLSSKGARINYLMVPATAFEKFLARFLYVTVVYLLLFLLSFLVADLLSALFAWAVGRCTAFQTITGFLPKIVDTFQSLLFSKESPVVYTGISRASMWLSSIVGLIFSHALFMLGGIIFNSNHAFIKTLLALIALRIVFSIIGLVAFFTMGFQGDFSSFLGFANFMTGHMGDFLWLSITIDVILILGIWYTAYWRVKTVEVVKGGRK